ncbi:MAG TPA: hypothetical protein VD794_16480 [Flavisolibacter sp.]|nr:hypothetical protein [Flavisolibacter sp.]
MFYNKTDLDNEIRELHFKILERRKAYHEGMQQDMPFEELKKIFVEIKELTKRQELCFEEANVQREG